MKKSFYTVEAEPYVRAVTVALVSDLHGEDPSDALTALREERPDYILMPGDIFEALTGEGDEKEQNGLRLLRESVAIAPTFYSTGNHEDGAVHCWFPWQTKKIRERKYDGALKERIRSTGVHLLQNEYLTVDGIVFGGLTSGLLTGDQPELSWLEDFCRADGYKILLCHHPEYFKRYLRAMPIDLTVSGHAHGGQWRFFGRGVFAPGQGIFPKYTSGVYENRLAVSRGLRAKGHVPRFFNPTETVFLRIKPRSDSKSTL